MPQKFVITQHYFLSGAQQWRMLLLSSPVTRKAGNCKISCGLFLTSTEKIIFSEKQEVTVVLRAVVLWTLSKRKENQMESKAVMENTYAEDLDNFWLRKL